MGPAYCHWEESDSKNHVGMLKVFLQCIHEKIHTHKKEDIPLFSIDFIKDCHPCNKGTSFVFASFMLAI